MVDMATRPTTVLTAPPLSPMLASPGTLESLGGDESWAFEMKWDGMRTVAYVEAGSVRLLSRNALDFTVSFPEISPLAKVMEGHSAIFDGELVRLDGLGRPSFGLLQKRLHVTEPELARRLAKDGAATLVLFDLLYLDGESLLSTHYVERRRMLEALDLGGAAWRTPASFAGGGVDAVKFSVEHHLEGVIAKRLTSTYQPGRRSPAWVKIKNIRTQEVVVGGWTPGSGRRAGRIGALLLGVPAEGALSYVGKVGTGFSDALLADLALDLARLATPVSAFQAVPPRDARDARWVLPQLAGEVSFTEWTPDRRLRHPSWRGLRPDKRPDEVTFEDVRVISVDSNEGEGG